MCPFLKFIYYNHNNIIVALEALRVEALRTGAGAGTGASLDSVGARALGSESTVSSRSVGAGALGWKRDWE